MHESLGLKMFVGVVAGTAVSAGAYSHVSAEEAPEQSGDVVTSPQPYDAPTDEATATEQPPSNEQEPEVTSPATSVLFNSGLQVVVTSGDSVEVTQQLMTEDTTGYVAATEIEPIFTDLPFEQQVIIPRQEVINTEQPAVAVIETEVLSNNPSQAPISITTNAASHIEIGADGAISIDVTATPDSTQSTVTVTDSSVAHNSEQTVQAQPSIAVAPSEQQTVSAETTPPLSNYSVYTATMQAAPEPVTVTNLKDVSVYESGGLLKRSAAYQEKMSWLKQNTTTYVTPAAYNAFVANGINTSLSSEDIFGPELPHTKLSDVQCYTMHWMAGDVTDPKLAAEAMLNRDVKANVQLMTMPDGTPYLITGAIDDKAFHAGAANNWCVGNEIAGEDLLDFTPQQTLSNIMITVLLHRQYGMPLVRDIATIEAQPINMYGDFVPIPRSQPDDFVGPIGHLEVEDAHKLDPTVMYVNYVYEQAVILNQQLNESQQQGTVLQPPQAEDNTEAPINELARVPQQTAAGQLSISQLLQQPILTQQQADLLARAEQHGFVADVYTPNYELPTPPIQPTPLPDTPEQQNGVNISAHLSAAAISYEVRDPVIALQTSSQSKQNGGTLNYEQAFGPALTEGDVYLYLRNAGATHQEAVILTAISARETGLRPGAVGDLKVKDGAFLPSYGLFQIRDLKDGNPQRDPAANLDPQKAAVNALAMLRQNGAGPWESQLPFEVTVQSVFEAIRLPNRTINDRIAFDERMRAIAISVLQTGSRLSPLFEGGEPM